MRFRRPSFVPHVARRFLAARRVGSALVAAGVIALTAPLSPAGAQPPASVSVVSATAPSPDPRLSLRAGWFDAGTALWNMQLVGTARPSTPFFNPSGATESLWSSDLAFTSHYVVQGNFAGFQIWDVSTPNAPRVVTAYVCAGGQGDVSVYRTLLFVSVESDGRLDCGAQGVKDSVSPERFRGIRIFDIGDVAHPRPIANVQTCRGSHTNTVVSDPRDSSHIYLYVSAIAPARPASELAGCSDVAPQDEANTQRFRIDVIEVPLAHPDQSRIVSRPALLADLAPNTRHEEVAADSADPGERNLIRYIGPTTTDPRAPVLSPLGPIATVCHDITTFAAVGLAGGACIGYGLLIDLHDPANPRRLAAASDSNFFGWHSATFNNDGTELLFSDEWGGGTLPRCRVTDNPRWGADAIYRITGTQLVFQGYYKLPVAQSALKNCVAHNGSLIPVPGRTIMVQAWYQGGVSVFDWTDAKHPREIAFFDRGPIDSTKLEPGGSWSAYWYNGYIYSSEITRGLDVLALRPSALLTQNELDAAKTVQFDALNVQNQPQFVWAPTFALARAYLDQLTRDGELPADRVAATARDLATAERRHGQARRTLLTALASRLDGDAATAQDAAKIRRLAGVARQLAAHV